MKKRKKNKDLILIVSEREKLLCELQETLSDNYSIICARSVPEALSAVTLKLPKMFIADTDIEHISGIDLLKIIRKGIKTKLIPFLLLSSKEEITEKIEVMQIGADDYLSYPFHHDELKAVVRLRLNKFNEFYMMSVTDELTRLFNRKEFVNKFNQEISANPGKTLSMGIMDIDLFKKVNDTYGHQMGDLVLMKLAEILKSKISDNFIPARFGGEEFVILFPGLDMAESKNNMQDILKEFSSYDFKHENSIFNVTFSAGIAEYPIVSNTASELLSRADQALYSAKEEGRNRIYIFNQIMIRNDKFWKNLTYEEHLFVDDKFNAASAELPYLPKILEEIMTLDFEIASIGVLIIKIDFIENAETCMHYRNVKYDIENIIKYIKKCCEDIFPLDMYMSISDFFSYEFTILFPSIFDFSAELSGFNKICHDIITALKSNLSTMNIDILYNSGVIHPDRKNKRNIFDSIQTIRKKKYLVSSVAADYNTLSEIFSGKEIFSEIENFLKLSSFYDRESGKSAYQFISLKSLKYNNLFPILMKNHVKTTEDLALIANIIKKMIRGKTETPILIPYVDTIYAGDYVKVMMDIMDESNIIIMFSEQNLQDLNNQILKQEVFCSEKIRIGLGDCFIDKEILSLISMHEFSLIAFSDNILRNINQYRQRISVVNGLKLFLDQIGTPALAPNISTEEEYQLLCDLNFSCFSGPYADKLFKKSD